MSKKSNELERGPGPGGNPSMYWLIIAVLLCSSGSRMGDECVCPVRHDQFRYSSTAGFVSSACLCASGKRSAACDNRSAWFGSGKGGDGQLQTGPGLRMLFTGNGVRAGPGPMRPQRVGMCMTWPVDQVPVSTPPVSTTLHRSLPQELGASKSQRTACPPSMGCALLVARSIFQLFSNR